MNGPEAILRQTDARRLPVVGTGIDDLPEFGAVLDLLHLGGQPAIAADPVLHRVGIIGHQVGGALELVTLMPKVKALS